MMRLVKSFACIALAALVGAWTDGSTATIPSSVFGAHALHVIRGVSRRDLTPWPLPVAATAFRMWDTETAWSDINTSDGVYDWSVFDAIVANAASTGIDLVYTSAKTPSWASSNPSLSCPGWNNGQCAPPTSNTSLTTFLSAVITRAAGRIKYWECWNEPNNSWEWAGTTAQMVALCQAAYNTIKAANSAFVVLTPGTIDPNWMNGYLAAGGGAYADTITMHAYSVGSNPQEAEQVVLYGNQFNAVAAANGSGGKPLWDTESSWADNTNLSDSSLQAGYVAKYFLLAQPSGVARRYFYAEDPNTTKFAAYWLNPGLAGAGITAAGTAAQQTQKWMIGAVPSRAVARQAEGNTVRNPKFMGAVAGTPGIMPTHMSVTDDWNLHGLTGTIVGTGTDSDGTYLELHIYGTYAGGGSNAVRVLFESRSSIAAVPGQLWTATAKIKLTAGSTANLTNTAIFSAAESADGTYIQTVSNVSFPLVGAPQSITSWGITHANAAWVYSGLTLQYLNGAVLDFQFRVYLPTLDHGSIWSGEFTRTGGYRAQAVWDQAGSSTYNVPADFTQYHKLDGSLVVGIGSTVTISQVPILLENKTAW